MSILKMEQITWSEIENLDKKKSVVLVALSPIEEHGPHLPLGTDYISAKDLLKSVVNNLEKQNKEYNPAKASREQGEIQFKEMVKKTGKLILNFIIYDDIPELSKGIKSAMNYIVLR